MATRQRQICGLGTRRHVESTKESPNQGEPEPQAAATAAPGTVAAAATTVPTATSTVASAIVASDRMHLTEVDDQTEISLAMQWSRTHSALSLQSPPTKRLGSAFGPPPGVQLKSPPAALLPHLSPIDEAAIVSHVENDSLLQPDGRIVDAESCPIEGYAVEPEQIQSAVVALGVRQQIDQPTSSIASGVVPILCPIQSPIVHARASAQCGVPSAELAKHPVVPSPAAVPVPRAFSVPFSAVTSVQNGEELVNAPVPKSEISKGKVKASRSDVSPIPECPLPLKQPPLKQPPPHKAVPSASTMAGALTLAEQFDTQATCAYTVALAKHSPVPKRLLAHNVALANSLLPLAWQAHGIETGQTCFSSSVRGYSTFAYPDRPAGADPLVIAMPRGIGPKAPNQ